MSLPFQCLSPLGGGTSTLFCAATGCCIQTFDLGTSPQPLFTWTHPSVRQAENTSLVQDAHDDGPKEGEGTEKPPPSKRRKLGPDAVESNIGTEDGPGTPDTPANGEKGQKKGNAKRTPPKPEVPFVVLLTATADGSHVLAVTGQDKTLWVFEHDGRGSLNEISRRAMPKRPCSLALTADGRTILSADKFGDVYALPLVPGPVEDNGSAPASASLTPTLVPSQPSRGANIFTVHSLRNRRALEDQQRQLESNAKRDLPKEGPKFAHEVLLGHVSMLTCVLTVSDSKTRPYIITADRDEHIRISRGMPQSHVIETYCLGHSSFVNALCSPGPRPDILISGGGDDELFVWDWLAGKLLGIVDLLAHVREILPDVTKIAVVKLIAYQAESECHVAVICERVPALFAFQLRTDNALSHRETIRLRGNALDIMTLGVAGRTLLAAIDTPDGDSEISVFERDGQRWSPRDPIRGTAGADEQPAFSRADLDGTLYTVENLRKTEIDEGADEAPSETPEQSTETQVD